MGQHKDRPEMNLAKNREVCEKANEKASETIKELKKLPRSERNAKPVKAKK